ncbi:MAG: hypothetical protein ACRCUY_09175 [Thermoguttaceae bacterium]
MTDLNISPMYQRASESELRFFSQLKRPTPVNMILDKTAVEFLLSLNTNNRSVNPERVAKLAWSIHNVGWKTCESLCVTQFSKLGNGQHRLFALQKLGFRFQIFTGEPCRILQQVDRLVRPNRIARPIAMATATCRSCSLR